MLLGLAQINTTVGDIEGNAAKAAEWIAAAERERCDLVAFPELTLPGYPAEDLYLQPHFARATARALEELAARCTGIAAVVGFAEPVEGADRGPQGLRDRASAHNSLALLAGGEVRALYRKRNLPSYGVFDETRQFLPGNEPRVVEPAPGGLATGLTICEDCWIGGMAAREEVAAGAGLILNSSASPWCRGRGPERLEVFVDLARSVNRPMALCNLVGAQDGLVFDGQSLVVGPGGEPIARAAQFEEELLVCDPLGGSGPRPAEPLGGIEEVRAGIVLGLRDYVEKNGFPGVVLGVSGGIDSALVAALATEALGPSRVTCVVMPSPHSSEETQRDARQIAGGLGANLIELPIEPAMSAYREILDAGSDAAVGAGAGGAVPSVADENVQARIRGNLVMAISNRDGLLALTCGNKSETAVGYATLYGDMAGGFAPIRDLPKTAVYELAREVARTGVPGVTGDPLPPSVLERQPSAELRPGQLDSDSLPPYPELDRALEAHVERDLSREEMVREGISETTASRVIALVRAAEHKRHQAPPGVRVSAKAFGRDRRMPITNRYAAGSW